MTSMSSALSVLPSIVAPNSDKSNRESAAITFLQNIPGTQIRHSETTLLAHLIGVFDKLKVWGCHPDVCLAGLFHSVYGTEHFRRQTIPIAARPRIVQLIGGHAEKLAYRFCTLNTKEFLAKIEAAIAKRLDISGIPREDIDLLHIFAANWLEQFPRMRASNRSAHIHFFKLAKSLLLAPAAAEVEEIFGFDNRLIPQQSTREIEAVDRGIGTLQILDDFVPHHLRHRLSALMARNIWRYGWKAAPTQTQHFFWHSHFAGDSDDQGTANCEHELHDRPLIGPVLDLWHLIRDQLTPGHVPVRVYANGHTYGGDGHVHSDADQPGHFTSIYYAHPEWQANWGGETLFYNADKTDVVAATFPRPGRLVHFSGNIFHAARSPSRDCPALRSVIVIKTYCPMNL
jgi:SM-20-related protein